MEIQTKSVQAKPKKTDGIRICIMRRIMPEFVFDIWMPTLSPSTKLLKKYHEKESSWNEYEVLFTKEVLDTQQKYLKIVSDIAKDNNITLLCWEETPKMCHRRLVAERLQKVYPQLEVIIR